jgi:acyl carrier protein phosphodiesterase
LNHLAHAYLGRTDNDWIIGNFVADYARGAVEQMPYSPAIKTGIAMHRAIDAFTDTHRTVHSACALLHSTQHKYAPIVIDVCFDYFIATNWTHYSPTVSLTDFSRHVCNVLQNSEPILPEPLQKRLPAMTKNNFLTHYAKYDGLQFAFESLAKRTRFDNSLLTALADFKKHETALNSYFQAFFPELEAFIAANYVVKTDSV